MRRSLLVFVLGFTAVLSLIPRAASQGKETGFTDPLPHGAIARVGTLRYRLPNGVNASALSPDGKLLAVAGDEFKSKYGNYQPGRGKK